MSDRLIFAQTIWGEARGEGEVGMTAVAQVILNRANIARKFMLDHGHPHSLFGNGTIGSACLRPFQFSCWNSNDPNRPKLLMLSSENAPELRDALRIADEAMADSMPNPVDGATHYCVQGLDPRWKDDAEYVTTIGQHEFYITA